MRIFIENIFMKIDEGDKMNINLNNDGEKILKNFILKKA